MRRIVGLALAVLAAGPRETAAQGSGIDPQCRASTVTERATQDACQKAIDLFRYLVPQLGVLIVGGNAVLGEATTLGGPGHASLGIRANAIGGRIPRADRVSPSVTGATSTEFTIERQLLGLPAFDAAIGLYPGISVAGSRAFGLDALVSLAYVPSIEDRDVKITLPDGSWRLGFGGRLMLLDESIITPSITVAYLRRDLPRVDLLISPGSDELAVRDAEIETSQWRASVAKHLALFELALGAGQDRYSSGASATVRVNRAGQTFTAGPVTVSQKVTRTSMFAGLSFNLALVRLAAEIGRVSGGTIGTFNTFEDTRADDALLFGSLGVRIHW
jgi:hypothetical protein